MSTAKQPKSSDSLNMLDCNNIGSVGNSLFSSCEPPPLLKRRLDFCQVLLGIEEKLARKLSSFHYPPDVEYIYNPIDYAKEMHFTFLQKFCNSKKRIMFLGMNPGPWGMSQTGVPFGEVKIVRDWFKISGNIKKPEKEHPQRPVMGLNCLRSEISGRKFWNFFKEICGEPCKFFQNSLVYNYCPLAYMTQSGKNITPAELKAEQRKAICQLCDEALLEVLLLYDIQAVVSVGKYCEGRVQKVVELNRLDSIKIGYMPHPSPRNVKQGNWTEAARKCLSEMNLLDNFLI